MEPNSQHSSGSGLVLIGSGRFRPFRNIWMLEELGVPYTHIPASPRSSTAGQYNALGQVPILKDGDFVMTESGGINTYLGDKFRKTGRTELIPAAGTMERGQYEQWVSFILMELDAQGLWVHRKHAELAGLLAPACPVAVETSRVHFIKCMKRLAEQLHAHPSSYLIPNFGFSAADILLVHIVGWAESIDASPRWDQPWRETPTEPMRTLLSYVSRCCERPAFKRAKRKQ
eukprot:6172132-Pleurochrysis_carterae.AAC.3